MPKSRRSSRGRKAGLTKAKAATILKDGSVRGHALTPAQRRLFGAIAGGNARRFRAT